MKHIFSFPDASGKSLDGRSGIGRQQTQISMPLTFTRYLRYTELTEALHQLAEQFPELMRLQSLGKSHEGRDIWCAIVTCGGDDRRKPALWVDGNIHSSELSASSACLHLLRRLLHDREQPDVAHLLQTRAFYIVPRVNPDGAELTLADRPVYLRSSVRPYPYDEEPSEGLRIEDIDGDGRVLQMRIADPNGPWKVYENEPRLLVRREPTDRAGGPYYRLLPEGRLLNSYDGVTIDMAPLKQRLDLNRNYPSNWRPEAEQAGAGPYPASEPEVRACVAFLTDHPNICHAVAFHTFSGVILRPYSHSADDSFPLEDLELFKRIGQKLTGLNGYPALSVYHDFRYHAKEVITGTFDDWAYEHLGLFAWTCEIWSAHRAAGLSDGFDANTASGKHRFIDWFDRHPMEEEVRLLEWSDRELDGRGYADWTPYDHPDFGPVEIGGWDMIQTFRNPPLKFLEKELEPLTEWVLWQAHTTPLLAWHSSQVEPLGDDTYRLQVVVQNQGYLSSYVTKKALERKVCRPVLAELEIDEQIQLIAGKKRQECGHLEGIAYKPASPLWRVGDPTNDRVKLEWVLRAPKGSCCTVTVRQERSGQVQKTFQF
jgi:murein tripeptide amidase MpaA